MDAVLFDASSEPTEVQSIESLYEVVKNKNKKNFICKYPDCGKVFGYKSEITRHVISHTNIRPHVCPYEGCGKGFKRQDALDNHIRIHTKETPYECPHEGCGKRFTTKASLRYHLTKHTADTFAIQQQFMQPMAPTQTEFLINEPKESFDPKKDSYVPMPSLYDEQNEEIFLESAYYGASNQYQYQEYQEEEPPITKLHQTEPASFVDPFDYQPDEPAFFPKEELMSKYDTSDEFVKNLILENENLKKRLASIEQHLLMALSNNRFGNKMIDI